MSLLLVESFDDRHYNLGKWDSAAFTSITGSGRTGNGAQITGGAINLSKTIAATATVIVGRAFYTSSLAATGGSPTIGFYTTSGTVLELNVRATNGYLALYRGATQIAITASAVLSATTFHYVELKGTLANSGGTADVQLDGANVISFTGDTLAGTVTDIDRVVIGTSTNTTDRTDDIYICDGTGSTNNTFLGDITVECLFPNGNGNSSVLVGSDADSTDNYLLVDETTPSTADHVGSATEGDKDTYAYGNITGNPNTILGVAVNSYQAKSDSGTKFARPVVRSGTTDYVGASVALSTAYLSDQQIWETDPDTASAWTESGINSAEFGFEVRDS